MAIVIGIGSKEKQTAFLARHEKFFERLESLLRAEDVIFNRSIVARGTADPVVFYLGIRVADDFVAVMNLASQGLGLSAMALVRGMYERVVTQTYLVEHPEAADRFTEFDIVQRYKAAQHVKQTIGVSPENETASEELSAEYARVKEMFEVPDCKVCKTKRLSVGWHRLDTVAMAYQFEPLRTLVVPAYYVPLGQSHATLKSISAYIREENGEYLFNRDHSEQGDAMFRLAHLLLMHNFALQSKHFKDPKIEKAAEEAMAAYFEIWPRPDESEAGT